jgi:hypothetical protein
MDESFTCECGKNTFWWFGSFLRCYHCHNEFKQSGPKGRREFWMRRFNKEEHVYDKNWKKLNKPNILN